MHDGDLDLADPDLLLDISGFTYYVQCGDCGHVFGTEDALIRDDAVMRQRLELPPLAPGQPVLACPHCDYAFVRPEDVQ